MLYDARWRLNDLRVMQPVAGVQARPTDLLVVYSLNGGSVA